MKFDIASLLAQSSVFEAPEEEEERVWDANASHELYLDSYPNRQAPLLPSAPNRSGIAYMGKHGSSRPQSILPLQGSIEAALNMLPDTC